jgi:hypothetical protein
MRVATSLVLCLATAVGLAACGGGSDTTVVNTTVTEPTSTSTKETPTTTSPSTGSSSLKSFRTPTGNIGCQVAASYARCDIREHTWKAPPKPTDCDLDWGNGVSVSGSGPGGVVCAGDTALDPSAPVLQYGKSSTVGSIECVSRESGVTCRKDATGHGFSLSRERYELF